MSTGAEVATVAARVEARPIGWDDMAKAIGKTLDDLKRTVTASLKEIPAAIGEAIAAANKRNEDGARQTADRIASIKQQFADREARLQKSATDYRVHLLEQERERTKGVILQTVKNREEAEALIKRNAAIVEAEITKIHAEEAAKRKTIADGEAKHEIDAQAKKKAAARQQLAGALAGTVGVAGGAGAGAFAAIEDQKNVAKVFDANMRDVNSIAKMTEAQLAKTAGSILDLGRTIPKTAADMSAGLYDLESSGFGVLKGGMDVLEKAAKAAVAGKATTGEAVGVLAGTLNAYGLAADQAGRVSDVLFKGVEKGVVTFPQMAHGLGNVTATANLAGVSIENVTAGIALMTSKNIPATQSFTSLNSLISKIITPSESATAAGKAMGLAWFNVAEAGEHVKKVGFAKALEEIAAATKGDAGRLKLLVEDMEAFRGASILAANGGRDFAASLKDMETAAGSSDAAFAEQMKSFENQEKLFQNAMDRVKIGFGTGALTFLNPLMQGFAGFLDLVSRLPAPIQAAIGAIEVLGATALVAVAGLAAFGLAAMGMSAIGPAFAAIKAGALAALPAVQAFAVNTLIALWPFLPIIGAIALACAALYAAWQLNLGGIRDFTAAVFKQVQFVMDGAAGQLRATWSFVGPYFYDLWEGVRRVFFIALGLIDGALRVSFGFFLNLVKAFASLATGNFSRFWELTVVNGGKALKALGQTIANGLSAIGDLVGGSVGDIAEMFGAMWTGITDPANAAGALSVMDAALASLKGRWMNTFYTVGVALEDFKAKGEDLVAKAGGAPKMPSGAIPRPGAPGSGGGAPPPGRVMTEEQVRKDVGLIMKRLAAHKISQEEAIKQLESYKKANKLTGDAALEVEEKVAQIRDKMAKAGAAGAKKAASEAKKHAAEAAAAQRKELKQLSDDYKRQYGEIERAAKAAIRNTADEKLSALREEEAELQRLSPLAKGPNAEALKNRLAAVREEMKKVKEEQAQAQQKITEELASADERINGDSLTRKLEKNKQHYDGLRRLAVKNSIEVQRLNVSEVNEEAKIRKDAAEAVQQLVEGAQVESLSRRLAQIDRQFATEAAKYKGQADLIEKIETAHRKAREVAIAEHNLKILDGLEKAAGDVLGFFDKIADSTATPFARIEAGLTAFVGLFRQQIANGVGGFVSDAQDMLRKTGKDGEAVEASMLDVGKAAVGAAAEAGASWFQALGPAGPIGAAAAAAVAIGLAFKLSLDAAAEREKKLAERTRAIREEVDALTLSLTKNRAELARGEFTQATRGVRDDETLKKRGDEINTLKLRKEALERNIANGEMFGDGAGGGLLARWREELPKVVEELDRTDGEYKARFNALTVKAVAELHEKLNAVRRDAISNILGGKADMAENGGDKAGARKYRRLAEEEDATNKVSDDLSAGLFGNGPDAAAKAMEVLNARLALIRKRYLSDETKDREDAFNREQDMTEATGKLRTDRERRIIEEMRAANRITEEERVSLLAAQDAIDQQALVERSLREVAFYEDQLGREGVSVDDRAALQKKLVDAAARAQSAITAGMKSELAARKDEIDAHFQFEQNKLEDQKKSEEEKYRRKMERENEELRAIEKRIKAEEKQLETIEEQIKAITKKYELQREDAKKIDKEEFNRQLAGVTLGADEKTFDQIEAQRKNAENRYRLEEITQEEFIKLSTQTTLKKAALAKLELDNQDSTFAETTRIQTTLADAYTAFQELQLDLIGAREEAEMKLQLADQVRHQQKLDSIKREEKDKKESIDRIEEKHRKSMAAIETRLREHKAEWDKQLKAISTGVETQTQAIVDKWGSVSRAIDKAIDKMRSFVSASGGSGNMTVAQAVAKMKGAATGGMIAGGIQGRDSVPMMTMPGELIVNEPTTRRLSSLLDMLMGSGSGFAGPRLALAGGGTVQNVKHVEVTIDGPIVYDERDINRLYDEFKERLARESM